MQSRFRELRKIGRWKYTLDSPTQLVRFIHGGPILRKPLPRCFLHFLRPRNKNSKFIADYFDISSLWVVQKCRSFHSAADLDNKPDDPSAIFVQNVLKHRREKPLEEIKQALDRCALALTNDFVLSVLRRHRSDWKLALVFFRWASEKNGYSPASEVYNEILDILGKMRRFDEVGEVFDEMSQRKDVLNEETYGVLLNRFAASHKIEDAIDIFHKRSEFKISSNLVAFQKLLMWLCRYKHVEVAETLFYSKQQEFSSDIKTRNIILNGWCVLGNLPEAKRFWNETVKSKCKPDMFTYGTFINALTKKGKIGAALKLFNAMWENGFNPDVVICNSIVYALCFKKRIPEALQVFKEMNERGCASNVATYNCLIKHLCKIQRFEKVAELLDEMEGKKAGCSPNSQTFVYLLKVAKEPEGVDEVLERMERNRCNMSSDMYNLLLRLYLKWDRQDKVKMTWNRMVENNLGPDQRSYTVMIHGFCEKGSLKDALFYHREMIAKGIQPEQKTEMLIDSLKMKLQEAKKNQQQIEKFKLQDLNRSQKGFVH